jgi:hypothetical protein
VNQLLQNYSIQVDYPDVSGAEHLEILQIRDRLAELETDLTIEEGVILAKADRKLMMNTSEIYQELSQFIDLPQYRLEQGVSPQKWWWYLDVLNYLPSAFDRASAPPGDRVSHSSTAQRDLESA